jgi:hypothetical protein
MLIKLNSIIGLFPILLLINLINCKVFEVFTRKNDIVMFEGAESLNDPHINDLLTFSTNNDTNKNKFQRFSFWKLPQYLIDIDEYLQTISKVNNVAGESLNSEDFKCGSLPLDKNQKYTLIKTLNKRDDIDFCTIKLPFSNLLIENHSCIGKQFCLAFNRKNYGVAFDALASFPCMGDNLKLCGIHLQNIALSIEGKLSYANDKSIRIFDGLRHQTIDTMHDFSMRLTISYPAHPEPAYNQGLVYYPLDYSQTGGFHFKLKAQVTLFSKFGTQTFFGVKMNKLLVHLYSGKKDLFSLSVDSAHGLLRYSPSATYERCYPSGIYLENLSFGTDNISSIDIKPKFVSQLLSGLIGTGLISFKSNWQGGIYMNFRMSEQNGFFFQGDVDLNLFSFIRLQAKLEIQKVSGVQLQRRLESLIGSSNCPDHHLTKVTQYLFEKFRTRNDKITTESTDLVDDWSSFYGSQAARSKNYYFVGHLKVKNDFLLFL